MQRAGDLNSSVPTPFSYVVGGFGVTIDAAGEQVHLPAPYRAFRCEGASGRIEVRVGDPEAGGATERPVVHGRVWTLCRSGDGWVVRVGAEGRVYVRGDLAGDFTTGVVTVSPGYADRSRRETGGLPFPFAYPLGEVAVVGRIGLSDGALLVHACGVLLGGRVHLFLGPSGAGKTTIARLWEHVGEGLVLSDDRIVVREVEGVWWAHGTPWHGEARVASARCAPVGGLHLLEHAPEPALVPMAPAEALADLFRVSFQPFWEAAGVARTLDRLARLLGTRVCQRFRFPPVEDSVRFLTAHFRGNP